ncbi:MAG: ferritin family protein [Anaerolineae bacterium]
MESEIRKARGALLMAIRIEQNGYRFYRRAAEETSDPNAKQMFEGLAQDEVAHESILRTRLKALEREGAWKTVGEEEWPDEGVRGQAETVFSSGRPEDEVHDYTSDLSAVRMAFLIEKNAVEFYSKAARETSDPVGKEMYQDLADWEKRHQRMLEREYKFLSDRFKLDMGFAPF